MSNEVDADANPVTSPAASRREFLQASAGLATLGASLSAFSSSAQAQGDVELTRLAAQRRILIKGGVVLSLDRQVGDFAQADVLIEDGMIRRSGGRHQSDRDAGLHRHPSSLLPGHPAQHPEQWIAQS
jgi:hypothetical protein